jgi:hypothetical protein
MLLDALMIGAMNKNEAIPPLLKFLGIILLPNTEICTSKEIAAEIKPYCNISERNELSIGIPELEVMLLPNKKCHTSGTCANA